MTSQNTDVLEPFEVKNKDIFFVLVKSQFLWWKYIKVHSFMDENQITLFGTDFDKSDCLTYVSGDWWTHLQEKKKELIFIATTAKNDTKDDTKDDKKGDQKDEKKDVKLDTVLDDKKDGNLDGARDVVEIDAPKHRNEIIEYYAQNENIIITKPKSLTIDCPEKTRPDFQIEVTFSPSESGIVIKAIGRCKPEAKAPEKQKDDKTNKKEDKEKDVKVVESEKKEEDKPSKQESSSSSSSGDRKLIGEYYIEFKNKQNVL